MIIPVGPNNVRLCCDECSTEPQRGFESFRAAAGWARANHWRIEREPDGSWWHFCPQCAKAIAETASNDAP